MCKYGNFYLNRGCLDKENLCKLKTRIFFQKRVYYKGIARSSNGRTTVSGTVYLGSNPSLATLPLFGRQGLRL
jgi:hypothetical protein